ncbi:MAG: hypothetical protein ABFC94_14010 [Syntrophomonas sp.]
MLVGVALAGIGLIGPAMALWPDGLSYLEMTNTGDLTGSVLFTKVYAEDNTLPHGDGWGTVSCAIDFEDGKKDHKITVDIDRDKNKDNWVCNSKIENQGTIPVRFLPPPDYDNKAPNVPYVYEDDALKVSYDLPNKVIAPGMKGLDPGEAVEGQIRIGLKTDVPGTYPFQIEIKCIQWNAYNEDPEWWNDTLHIYGTVVVEEPPAELQQAP